MIRTLLVLLESFLYRNFHYCKLTHFIDFFGALDALEKKEAAKEEEEEEDEEEQYAKSAFMQVLCGSIYAGFVFRCSRFNLDQIRMVQFYK